jgi:predicted nucleotidyltransferase component of viral defense system
MIRTSRQLKALVRNRSEGSSAKAQIIIRCYAMERFLERLSFSAYRNNFILKGGTLITAMVGLELRSTMDIDATIKSLPLSEESAKRIVEEIVAVPVDDGVSFEIKSVGTIMGESEYSGVRITMDAVLETMVTPFKIDFSTGDVITPKEVEYSFRLLFENRDISILAYNLETVLAEKFETLFSRGTANTRMRDFYDIFALESTRHEDIDPDVLRAAFSNTCGKHGTAINPEEAGLILDELESSAEMSGLWLGYQRKFDYTADISWYNVIQSVRRLCNEALA